ncbi:protein kinase domain-containing protein [Nocardia tengchongensis]|uniref:protein kinase domain-containing protein n=3 Tax=Nocardia tengchongensis TaxID=2055889 RepID=UPI0036B35761
MVEDDPLGTHRDMDLAAPPVAELSSVGFEDAEEIGRGGFGVVCRCTQRDLDRVVAVKVLTTAEPDEESRARFLREQRAMGRLTGHPNIVGVLQIGEISSGRPYLVMQCHERGSLEDRIRRDGPLSVDEALRLGIKVAGALETAHRLGIVHRDVKPANILFTEYGEPALCDFGVARIAGGFETTARTVMASPAFAAPEVLDGHPPGPASDVYGLGSTLFCALTGHAAFERQSGEQVVAQFLRITTDPVPDLRTGGIPADVCAAIETAMDRDPSQRPSAVALGKQLQRIQRDHGYGVDEMTIRGEPDNVQEAHVPERGPCRRSVDTGALPLELTSFVGRKAQLSEVKKALSESRLVTLTGIGGVGKTRLASRAASRLRRGYADGVRLVEFGDIDDPELVDDIVATSVGVRNLAGRPTREVLVEFLSTRRILLVLDNCEHLVGAVADLADSLLRACVDLSILATSREVLGIGGESVLPVTPLGFPDPSSVPTLGEASRCDAVELFVERAAAVVPGFELTRNNRLAVARICARLDGLPLAIELATARLRVLSADQILRRLDDRYTLLTAGNRDVPTRQQTLWWCIGWSYDLCTPREQQLWWQLSIFAHSFDLDAAEQVCGTATPDPDLLDALFALVEKSILIREESGGVVRFRMLDTVQNYGRRKLEEAREDREIGRRHRDWYERLAFDAEAEWISPRQLEWDSRLKQELPNLRKAMEFDEAGTGGMRIAAALFSFWYMGGRITEGRSWLDRTLAHSAGGNGRDRAKALYSAGMLAAAQADLAAATARVAELRGLARQMAGPEIAVWEAVADGYTALVGDDLGHAVARLEQAGELVTGCSDPVLRMDSSLLLGWAYQLSGDLRRAVACHEQALAFADSRGGEASFRSWLLWAMGTAVWRQGALDRATDLLQESLRHARSVDDPLIAATSLEALAWIASDRDDVRRACVLMGAAEARGQAAGSSSILFPNLATYHEACERRAQETLGTREFEKARAQGGAMSFAAAAAFGLEEDPPSLVDRVASVLTKREQQVAELVAEGLTNSAIAGRLMISRRTAQGHVEHILTKLGFTSRAQIARWVGAGAGPS